MSRRYGKGRRQRKQANRARRKAGSRQVSQEVRETLQLSLYQEEIVELLQNSLDQFAIEIGRRVAVGLLPRSLAMPLARLEPIGLFIIIGALFILPWLGQALGLDLNFFDWLIGEPATFLLRLIVGLSGLE